MTLSTQAVWGKSWQDRISSTNFMAHLKQFIKNRSVSLLPWDHTSIRDAKIWKEIHLQEEIWSVMEAQHQSSNPHHVIHVRECDESNRGQVMDEHDQEVLETGKPRVKILWLSHKCKRLEQSHPTESPGSQDSCSGSDVTLITAHHTPTISTEASRKVSQLWCCWRQSSACSGISTVSLAHTKLYLQTPQIWLRGQDDPYFWLLLVFTDTLLIPSAPGTHLSAVTAVSDQTLPGQSRHRTPGNSAGRMKNVYSAQHSGLPVLHPAAVGNVIHLLKSKLTITESQRLFIAPYLQLHCIP